MPYVVVEERIGVVEICCCVVVEEGDEIDLKTLYILGRKRGDRCARASLSRFTTSTQKEWDDAI